LAVAPRLGPPDQRISTLKQLQVPLVQVRAALRIAGMTERAAVNLRDKSQMKDVLRAAGSPSHATGRSREWTRTSASFVSRVFGW
jgi:hypothetical protein